MISKSICWISYWAEKTWILILLYLIPSAGKSEFRLNQVGSENKSIRELEKEVEGLRSLVKASKSGLEDYGRLRVELESTRKRLEKYESTDKGALMKQLDQRDEEIRALKLKDKESTAVN